MIAAALRCSTTQSHPRGGRMRARGLMLLGVVAATGACAPEDDEAPPSSCQAPPCEAADGDGDDDHDNEGDNDPDTGADAGTATGDGDVEDCAAGASLACFLDERVPTIVDAAGAPGKAIGLMVGVVAGDTRVLRGYGATVRGGATPPDASTIFEIASVTKVVTGYLAARAVGNGELLLTHPISTYFGEDVPSFAGTPIRLVHLATHRSGLPSYPDNVLNPGAATPGAGYTRALLEEFLASYALPRAPGAAYEYSNLGSGMLGEACVDAAGVGSYEALVQREVAIPMGLADFDVELDEEQRARKIQGYAMGAPAPALIIGPPLQGAGALHATATDLLTFVAAALDGNDPAWEAVKRPLAEQPVGENAEIGLQLAIEHPTDGPVTYSKNGGAPGFTSQIVFTIDPPVAVVLLSNAANTQGLLPLGKEIIDAARSLGLGD